MRAIAKMIDHSLLHPTLTDQELIAGCQLARKYDVASVCIKSYAIQLAKEQLKGSEVFVSTVIGFPSGSHKVEVKLREAELALVDGQMVYAGASDYVLKLMRSECSPSVQ